jgi:SAM-dependent methyltransferase
MKDGNDRSDAPVEPGGANYEALYRRFDSPLMRQLRREAYDRDIGQHSWVGADELERGIGQLGLGPAGRLLDLGCGPCGPLCFVLGQAQCGGTGTDISAAALAAGRARAESLGLGDRVALLVADLNRDLPFSDGAFDAAMSLDVIVHLRDRLSWFREVRRVLKPGGRLLFTDAGVVTGAVSSDEIRQRALHGDTFFVPDGFNEHLLERAGLRAVVREDRTESLLRNAGGRLAARLAHRAELEEVEGGDEFERQRRYLEVVDALARRGAMSRFLYVAESAPA